MTDDMLAHFEQSLLDCQRLYLSSAEFCVEQFPGFLPGTPAEFIELMDDLHKGLLIKIYVEMVAADSRWSREEKRLGQLLFHHIWPGKVTGSSLRETANHVFEEACRLKWHSLVRPFGEITPLRDRIGELETIVLRIANLVAKVDGEFNGSEDRRLRSVQRELEMHLHQISDKPREHEQSNAMSNQAVQELKQDTEQVRSQVEVRSHVAVQQETKSDEERLAESLERLDALTGLEQIKKEIRTLANFVRLQQERAAAGLPQTDLSLHLVFSGNPGTGKTTVARIVGQIYGSMGMLSSGHLIETDRSGLVAEYAGQTGPKTNKKVDEALDGVLFVDEAYSLVAESGEDPYGREAVQTLLKRMEDDRQRLVVILAGYPGPMQQLLSSNPGLSSRFNTKLTFEDYLPIELCQIFASLCDHNHYSLPPEAQLRLLLGSRWLYETRNDHFGNGRLVRNVFETAIRRLANRIAGVSELSKGLLTTIEPDDVQFDGVPDEVWQEQNIEELQLQARCDGCGDSIPAPASYLGRRVRCRRCKHRFILDWGELDIVE
jgi:hypothetical protein